MNLKSLGDRFLSILVLSLSVSDVYGAISPPVVDVGFTKYQGIPFLDTVANVTNTNFLGMRYAAPPTGIHRFAAPQPPTPTAGVQLANAVPNSCFNAARGTKPTSPFRIMARADAAAAPVASEDCLFLNVYVPGNLGDKQNLPVVFWIHGGGYIAGSATAFGNDLLRKAGGGVIAVVIQYRLGVFGFLPGQKVKDGGALNAGLLDQQFALQWVQQHISSFGGDPTKVTIWGESAGAGSVLQQVIANGGRTTPPLFRAGITSSVFLPPQYKFNDSIPETLYSEVVSQTQCSSSLDTLACIRATNITTLQAANLEINASGFFGTFVFVPVVDGTFITDRPSQILKQGELNGAILYAVTNTFEGTAFVNQSNTITVTDYASRLYPNLTPAQTAAVAAQYAGLGTNIFQMNAIYGESIFICPTYSMILAFNGSAYKTEFAIPPGLHGNDLAYYFPSMNANGIPPFANPQFGTAFSEAFLNFVIALNPNVKFDKSNVAPTFQLWNGSNEMLFNKTAAGAPDIRQITTSTALLARCNFWASVAEQTAQ